MQETWVQSLDWEDPLEKGMTTHSSILVTSNSWDLLTVSQSEQVGLAAVIAR